MKETWHKYDFDFKKDFPDAISAWAGSFEQVYFAEQGSVFYFIYDGRLVIDFAVAFSISDDELEEYIAHPDEMRRQNPIYQEQGAIQVIEFGSAEERAAYLQENYVDKVKTKISFQRKLKNPDSSS